MCTHMPHVHSCTHTRESSRVSRHNAPTCYAGMLHTFVHTVPCQIFPGHPQSLQAAHVWPKHTIRLQPKQMGAGEDDLCNLHHTAAQLLTASCEHTCGEVALVICTFTIHRLLCQASIASMCLMLNTWPTVHSLKSTRSWSNARLSKLAP